MPWESKTVEEIRKEFVEEAKTSTNFSALCRAFGITRKAGYKRVERYKNGLGLSDQSKRLNVISNKTSEEAEKVILSLKNDNPGWEAKTIKAVLENQGYNNIPCIKTVNNILNRNGYISKEESDKRYKYVCFQKNHCNEMWQTDFKGDFGMNNGKRCYPLDIIDDCSRYLIKITPSDTTKTL